MFTWIILHNGREVENLSAGKYATEAEADHAGLVVLDDLCPLASPNRRYYRVVVVRA